MTAAGSVSIVKLSQLNFGNRVHSFWPNSLKNQSFRGCYVSSKQVRGRVLSDRLRTGLERNQGRVITTCDTIPSPDRLPSQRSSAVMR